MKLFNFFNLARHHPWLIGLVVTVVVGIVILVEVGAVERFGEGGKSSAGARELSAVERNAQLTIMNIVNRFNLTLTAVPAAPAADRSVETLKRLSETRTQLAQLELPRRIQPVQRDLVGLFDAWGSYLQAGEDTTLLRDDFLNLGAQYPWLSTLLWIIVLNRL